MQIKELSMLKLPGLHTALKLLIFVFFLAPSSSNSQSKSLDAVGQQLAGNVAFIRASYETNGCRSKSGFGFLVAENATELTLAIPKHVVQSSSIQVGCLANELTVSILVEGVEVIEEITSDAIVFPKVEPSPDVVFVNINRPEMFKWTPFTMASPTRLSDVSYLGYRGQRITPIRFGTISTDCNGRAVNDCEFTVENLPSVPGESGSPVFDSAGNILGSVRLGGSDNTTEVLSAQSIRAAALSLSLEWQLFFEDEQQMLGEQLNSLILNGDTVEATRIAAIGFNLDRRYESGSDDWGQVLPLRLAAYEEMFEVVVVGIEQGARDTRIPALISASKGQADVIEHMIDHKVDISCALAYALQYGHTDVVEVILTASVEFVLYNPNEHCIDRTPLYWALLREEFEIAKGILNSGADPNSGYLDRIFPRGNPLTLAILKRDDDTVRLLIQSGADVTALEYPSESDPIGHYAYDIFGPLHAAAYIGDLELVRKLISLGSDPDGHRIQSQGEWIEHDMSPIEAALWGGQVNVAEYLFENYEVALLGRYAGSSWSILEEIASSGMPDATKQRVLRFLERNRDSYCNRLENLGPETFPGFYMAESKCR